MMSRELLHIWGPISIYSYGFAIAVGLLAFVWLFLRNPLCKSLISKDKFIETVSLSLIVGLAGARFLFVINSLSRFESFGELFTLWSGGLSMLGGLLAILIFLPWWLKRNNVPILPFLDLAAIYAPLLHSISRLGCFMAGCCYGQITSLPWGITYTDLQSEAPLNVPLHPTQLYMSAILFCTFLLFYFVIQKKVRCSGQLLMLYLIVESSLRFTIDYWRADIEYFAFDSWQLFSAHQWISLGMFGASIIGFVWVTKQCKKVRATTV